MFKPKAPPPQFKKHNWTKETLGECARVHLEQIAFAYYNLSGKNRTDKINHLIEHYESVLHSLGSCSKR